MYKTLALHNFRSYSRYALALSPAVNIVVGPNGSGKTNLLEALYVMSAGSSFRAAERDLIAHGSDWFRLEALWGDQQRVLTYRAAQGQKPEKQFSLDGTKKARLTHEQRLPVVLFEPNHLRLLTDSPAMRRDYLDTLLTALQPDFAWLKHQFDRTLLQRNNLLKRRLTPAQLDDYLFAWDITFAELAQSVVERRQGLVQLLAQKIGATYSAIAGKPSDVAIAYHSTITGNNYQAQALKTLRARRSHDVARGFTTIGPQRDDFSVQLNGAPAEVSASRGELRSLLLALKMIELELIGGHSDHTPLLLLDDVFSELDATRRKALTELAGRCQTVITTTDIDPVMQNFTGAQQILLASPTQVQK